MKFRSLYAVLTYLTCFLVLSFMACDKEEHDNIKPTVKIIEPIEGDTLYLDSICLFRGEFWDDKALSSYFIQIHNPNISDKDRVVVNTDSTISADSVIYLNNIIQRSNIFDIDSTIIVENSFRLDTIGYYKNRGPFPIKTGSYQFKVVVMDKAGNRDSSFFDIQIALPL